MEDIVIVSAARTAVGKFGGSLAKVSAMELGSIVIREAIARAKLSPDQVGEVIMGQVLAAGCGQNPARQATLKAGLAMETLGRQRHCGRRWPGKHERQPTCAQWQP